MIDGAEHFHYLGLARRHRSVLMVFQEGVLILDLTQPGWGAMPPSALAQLVPDLPEQSSSESDDSGNAGNPTSDSDGEVFDSLSGGTLSTSSSTTSTPSHSATPSPAGSRAGSPARSVPSSPREAPPALRAAHRNGQPMRERAWWHPLREMLGWHPCETLVFAGPVPLKAIREYTALASLNELQAFVAQLKAGHWAPLPAGSPGDATMVAVQMFGELHVMVWEGIWHAAGNGEHLQHGMTNMRACQLVASAVVAEVCSLALVPYVEHNDYLAHVQSGAVSVMVFKLGLLVRSHPDPELVGWHDLNDSTRGGFVSPADADTIEKLCRSNYSRKGSMFKTFFDGMMDVTSDEGPFVAAIFSHRTRRWFYMRLDMPHVQAPDDPAGPTPAAVIQALRQTRPAPVNDLQAPDGPLSLTSGEWQVPVFLGAIQCIAVSVDVPGLLGARWHDTLRPVIEQRLLAHRPQESAWLASGVIMQPIDRLIDLMRRDLGLRRQEVRVMWPVELLEDLFKTLAPQEKTRVVITPKAADVDLAFQKAPCTLLVFQAPSRPEQSVVLVQNQTCWCDTEPLSLAAVKKRVAKALAPGATERLVALAYIVM